jgi:peptide/nickel transport system permease protein
MKNGEKKIIKMKKRIFEYMLTLFIIISLNFFLPRLLPGNPLVSLARGSTEGVGSLSQKQVEYYMDLYNLNESLGQQYVSYLKELIHLDFGKSIIYNLSVLEFIKERVHWTLLLIITSLIVSTVVGVTLGAISAYKRYESWDSIMYFLMLTLSEIPSFIIGLFFLLIFAVKLKIFPLFGAYSYYAHYGGGMEKFIDVVYHALLPIIVLSFSRISSFYFIARNSVISVLKKDYIRTAKAKGLSKYQIIMKHALRNAMLPIVTRIFLSIGSMIGGTILIENVFAYPGLGLLMREAVSDRDYPLIQGLFLTVTILTLTANFIADLAYKSLDPRIRKT